MRGKKRSWISLALCLCMLVSLLPASALAVEAVCTCSAVADADGVTVHQEECPLYEEPAVEQLPTEQPPAQDECTCGAVADEEGMIVHREDCPLYEEPAVEQLPTEQPPAQDECTCGAVADEESVTVHREECPLYEEPVEQPAAEQEPGAELGQDDMGARPAGEGAWLTGAAPHNHNLSGDGSDVTFTSTSALGGTLRQGSYYLSHSVTATSNITINSGIVNLCLNGCTLDMGDNTITVNSGATLNICDCGERGAIIGTDPYNRLILVQGGTLNVYSGEISLTDTKTSGNIQTIELSNNSTASFTGGTVKLTATNTNMSGSRRVTTVYQNGGTVTVGGTATLSLQLAESVYIQGYGAFCVTGGGHLMVNGGTMQAFFDTIPVNALYLGEIKGSGNGTATIEDGSIGHLSIGTSGTATVEGGRFVGIHNSGTLNMSGGTVGSETATAGEKFGVIQNDGEATLSGITVKASDSTIGISTDGTDSSLILSSGVSIHAGTGVYALGTVTIQDGVTITAAQYGVIGGATLIDAPSISGGVADLLIFSIGATAADSAPVDARGYTGEELTVQEAQFPDVHQSGYTGYAIQVSNDSEDKFTLKNGGSFTYQSNGGALRLYNTYSHPICGDVDCTAHGDDVEWQAWTPTSTGATLTEGNYYLDKDVTLNGDESQIKITGTVNLCLNGHTITGTANNGIFRIGENGVLNICDCSAGQSGAITETGEHNPIVIHSGGVCSLYSGTIRSSITAVVISGDGAGNQVGGTFNLYGGEVESTAASGYQAIFTYENLENARVNVYGGTASSDNYAVTLRSGIVTLSGSPGLEGGNGDIYLPCSAPKVAVEDSLAGQFSMNMDTPGVFTVPGMEAYQSNFTSAKSGYDVMVTDNGALMLSSGYTVTFDLGGADGTVPASQKVQNGGTANKPADPSWTGHTFVGWYHGGELWDFNAAVTSDMTLAAKWMTNPVITGTNGLTEDYGTGGTISVTVAGEAGHTYVYQWQKQMEDGTWQDVVAGTADSYTIAADTPVGDYTYQCIVTASIGNVTSPQTISDPIPVTINAKKYSEESGITIAPIGDQIYTGRPITPDVTVTYGSTPLQEGTDYTLLYGDNINAGTGAGTVTISFTGNYTGETTVYFDIVYAALPTGTTNETVFPNYGTISGTWNNEGGVTFTPDDGWTVSTEPGGPYGGSVTFHEEGQQAKTVYVQKDGEIYETQISYKLDKTAPTVSDVEEPGQGAPWTDENVIVSFDASDAAGGSGVASVAVTGPNGSVHVEKSGNGQYTFDATENGTYTVAVTDEAGNKTEQTIHIGNIDKTTPGLTVTGGDQSAPSLVLQAEATQKGGSPVTVTATDSSGQELSAGENGQYTITQPGQYTFTATTAAGGAATVKKTVYRVTFERGNGTGTTTELVVDGGKVTRPTTDPHKDGYTFGSWMAGQGLWDFENGQVTSDLTLTAGWTLKAPEVTITGADTVTYGATITLAAQVSHDATGLNYTYQWYKNGQPLPGETGQTLTLSLVAHTGSYTVEATAWDGSQSKAAQSEAVDVTIRRATPVVSAENLTLTYGHVLEDKLIQGTASWNGKEVPGSFAWGGGKTGTMPVVADSGSYSVVFTPDDEDNYTTAGSAITLTVERKTLLPSVSSVDSKIYDGTVAAVGSIALEGAVGEEKPTATGIFTFVDAAAGTNKPVNVADITLEGSWGNNYVLSVDHLNQQPSTASIGTSEVSFAVSQNHHVYDGTAKIAAVTQDAGQVEIPDGGYEVEYLGAESQTNAGIYDITVTLTNDNFCFAGGAGSKVVGQLTIEKAVVAIPQADTTQFIYNGQEQTYTIAPSERYTVSGNVQRGAGTHTVTVALKDTENYLWSDNSGEAKTYEFVISKRSITGTWMGIQQVYDDLGSTAILPDGLTDGDSVAEIVYHYTGTTDDGVAYDSSEPPTQAGKYTVTASMDNYTITNPSAQLIIQKKPVTATVTDNAVAVGDVPQVSVPGVPEEDYNVVYKDDQGNVVSTPDQPGRYEVWVQFPEDGNYRHPDGSSEALVGSFIVAQTKPAAYTVTFDGGDGVTGSMEELQLAGGSILTLPQCGYEKSGYQFGGWLYGTRTYRPGDQVTTTHSAMTFTAQWEKVQRVTIPVQSANGDAVEHAVVTVWQGSNKLEETASYTGDGYQLENLPAGSYNVTVSAGEKTVTSTVTVTEDGAVTVGDTGTAITLPQGATNSIVEVTPGTPSLVVGKLNTVFDTRDEEVYTDADADMVEHGGKVEIVFTADEQERDEVQEELELLESTASNLSLFLDCKLTKTVTDPSGVVREPQPISKSSVLLEVRLPLPTELQGKYGYTVSRIHAGQAQVLTSTENELGEYFEVSGDKTFLTLHVCCFSTYAVGYRNAPSSSGTMTYPPVKNESENGSFDLSPSRPEKGQTVTITPKPVEGYEVEQVMVVDQSGKTIDVTPKADGTYTFTQPGLKVTITVTFRQMTDDADCPRDESCPLAAFTDVDVNAWYHDGTHYCLENGLMSGYGDGVFAPDSPLSRGMLVQILYNLEGRPDRAGEGMFEDVPDGAWYADAVNWAASKGIVGGYGNGKYGPEDSITREQFAAILYRYAQYKGYDVSVGENTNLLSYSDAVQISEYAIPAMQWACGTGIIGGVTDSTLVPAGTATRAQVAVMLMQFVHKTAQ